MFALLGPGTAIKTHHYFITPYSLYKHLLITGLSIFSISLSIISILKNVCLILKNALSLPLPQDAQETQSLINSLASKCKT